MFGKHTFEVVGGDLDPLPPDRSVVRGRVSGRARSAMAPVRLLPRDARAVHGQEVFPQLYDRDPFVGCWVAGASEVTYRRLDVVQADDTGRVDFGDLSDDGVTLHLRCRRLKNWRSFLCPI